MTSFNLYDLAEKLIGTAKRAGQVQLDIYATDFEVSYKDDDSPVSQADIASEKIILADLAKIAPKIPVLAEEAASAGDIPDLTTAEGGTLFFCVDPLDGTKEFIKKNDEFTVNIALIENGVPIFGLVYAPALSKIFVTVAADKALSGEMKTDDPDKPLKDMGLKPMRARQDIPKKGLSVVASRSHMSSETEDYLKKFKVADLKSAGSSLKLCMVASGEADLYPRFAPTMEWDTAAGHGVVLAAGGTVVTQDGKPLGYNKKEQKRPFLNPFFIVQSAALSRANVIMTAGTDRILDKPVADLEKSCPTLANAPLMTARHASERLKSFVRYAPSVVVILVDQNDGLSRWVFQDITMAAILGATDIIVAPYYMADESDPEHRLEDLSDELATFVATADISVHVSCAPLDMPTALTKGSRRYLLVDEALKNAQNSQKASQKNSKKIDPDNPNQTSDQFGVFLAWYDDKQDMLPGRSYTFSLAGYEAIATISELKYELDLVNGSQDAAKTISGGRIAYCNISLNKPMGFEPFKNDQTLGHFSLKDKNTGRKMAWGRIEYSLARATNLRWQSLEIDKAARAQTKQQKPFVLWFTGLSGCGKSTIASLLEKKLHDTDKHTYVLDGDNVRHGLCRDLGFVDADRVENMRRVSETAKLFVDAGLIVLVSFIAPFRSERDTARRLFEDHEFFEVFVDTPLEICESRDIKGLYKKARAGLVPNFTGISSPYEAPKNADFHLDGNAASAEEMTDILLKQLQDKGLV